MVTLCRLKNINTTKKAFIAPERLIQMLERKHLELLSKRVESVIGAEALNNLTHVQRKMCEVLLTKRLEKVQYKIDLVTDDELIGIYEMVVNELQPYDI